MAPHFKHPVIYMSRDTTREIWQLMYDTEPDLSGDLRYGQSQIPVLFDDRLEFGTAQLDEDPAAHSALAAQPLSAPPSA
jgi:hypothetical protein